MKILRQLWNQEGLDAAVESAADDRYGFKTIAENIAQSVLSLRWTLRTSLELKGHGDRVKPAC